MILYTFLCKDVLPSDKLLLFISMETIARSFCADILLFHKSHFDIVFVSEILFVVLPHLVFAISVKTAIFILLLLPHIA